MKTTDTIVTIARSYLGKQEIQPNMGFKDKMMDTAMRKIGFRNGDSWCGWLAMLILFTVYAGTKWLPLLKKYASASTILTWNNFKASKEFITGQVPKVGAIVIWSEPDGKSGHEGLVVTANGMNYTSVEGNTNSGGSRNGFDTVEHSHIVPAVKDKTKRFLLGFVYMPEI